MDSGSDEKTSFWPEAFLEQEVTNARKLLPHGQNFGLGCSKSGYNPRIIQTYNGNITLL
jgi:hypothetical protein